MSAPEKGLVCRDAWGVPSYWRRLRRQLHLQRRRNCLRDFVLYRKHIDHLPVVTLRPEVIPIRGVDQLRGYPDPVSRAPNAAFQNRSHVQDLSDFSDVQVFTTE